MRVIYIEDVLLDNLLLNALALWGCAMIARRPFKRLRVGLAAAFGAVYALSQVVWGGLIGHLLLRILVAVAMLLIAFRETSALSLLKLLLCFLGISFLFAGASFAFAFFGMKEMYAIDGVWYYAGLPLYIPAAAALVCCLLIRRLWHHLCTKMPIDANVLLEIAYKGKRIAIQGLLDSGHSLLDPFSKLPVLVVELDAIREFVSESLFAAPDESLGDIRGVGPLLPPPEGEGLIWVPYQTVGCEDGMMTCFRPESVRVRLKDRWVQTPDALVGISDRRLSQEGEFSALVPLSLLRAV